MKQFWESKMERHFFTIKLIGRCKAFTCLPL